MVGNVGGYIGLCLGYGILQVPNIIVWVLYKLKKYFSEEWKMGSDISPMTLSITVHDNGEDGNAKTNENYFEKDIDVERSENCDDLEIN